MTTIENIEFSKMDIKRIKALAKKMNTRVDNLLALSKTNDPFYIQRNSKEKAEKITEIWKKEGSPTIHPRGLHYRILGEGYHIKISFH